MNFFTSLVVFSILALGARDAFVYATSAGTTAQRLAACWRDSLTVFFGVWGFVASLLTVVLDFVAYVTGAPEFTQLANLVQSVLPEKYHPFVPLGASLAMLAARFRTLPR